MIVVGVISDTHIPDRVEELHPGVIPVFTKAGVSTILHAGDISTMSVLKQLEQAAPVIAVRGNRDLSLIKSLPLTRLLEFNGVKVALMHGHGGWLKYIRDKFFHYRDGYRLERYFPLLLESEPEAGVVVYGHTHFPENKWLHGKLLFNPGSAGVLAPRLGLAPSVGLLRFDTDGSMSGEIIQLRSLKIKGRHWVEK